MDLNLKDSQLEAIISKAILDSLTTETREQLITTAVTDILQKPENAGRSGEKRSRLQIMFDRQVEFLAEKLIREQLGEDSMFRTKVKVLLRDVSEKLFDDKEKRPLLIDKMVETIIKGLNPREY